MARERLKQKFAERDVVELLQRLDRLVEEIDYRYMLDGLALFASRNHSRLYLLPFSMAEHFEIGESCAFRELADLLRRTFRYWVLVLTEPRVRLLWGCNDHLSEASLESFPLEHFVHEAPEERVVSVLRSQAVPGTPALIGARAALHRCPGTMLRISRATGTSI